jgi:glycosyltransferase involved in cell wall biosynthesis
MSALDVLCLASIAEGFPNVVAEGMLMQLPCVVTDVGDAARMVGEAGIVVPPRRPDMLASGLLKIKSLSDAQRKVMGQAARKKIADSYGIEVISRRYAELYAGLLIN